MAAVMKNALASVAALLCKQDAHGIDNEAPLTRISNDALNHLHGYRGSIIDDRDERFKAAEAAGEVDYSLDNKTKFVRVLNTVLGLSVEVKDGTEGQYQFEATEDLFTTYDVIEQNIRTPKNQRLTDKLPEPDKQQKRRAPLSSEYVVDSDGDDDNFDMPATSSITVSEEAIAAAKALGDRKASRPKARLSSGGIMYNLSSVALGKRKVDEAMDSSAANSSAPSTPSRATPKRPKRQAKSDANKALMSQADNDAEFEPESASIPDGSPRLTRKDKTPADKAPAVKRALKQPKRKSGKASKTNKKTPT